MDNKDQANKEMWNKLASLYEEKFMDLGLYDDTYDFFCAQIKTPEAGIFEIACGPGNITRQLLNRNPEFKILASDISPEMIHIAQKNVPEARFSIMDCRNIDSIDEKFDGIVCGFCLPYLNREDCEKFVTGCSRLLNKGGVFYVSTIEGTHEKSDWEYSSNRESKIFVYLYEEEFLSDLLQKNSFRLLQLFRKNYSKSDGTKSVHLIFVAEKI